MTGPVTRPGGQPCWVGQQGCYSKGPQTGGGLKQQKFMSDSSGGRKPKVKGCFLPVSSRGLLSYTHIPPVSLYSYEDTSAIGFGPRLHDLIQISIPWELGSTYGFRGDTVQSRRPANLLTVDCFSVTLGWGIFPTISGDVSFVTLSPSH